MSTHCECTATPNLRLSITLLPLVPVKSLVLINQPKQFFITVGKAVPLSALILPLTLPPTLLFSLSLCACCACNYSNIQNEKEDLNKESTSFGLQLHIDIENLAKNKTHFSFCIIMQDTQKHYDSLKPLSFYTLEHCVKFLYSFL